jgi:hypothetical protein
MNQILPRNRFIEFDVNEYLGMNETDVVVEPRAQDRETETL